MSIEQEFLYTAISPLLKERKSLSTEAMTELIAEDVAVRAAAGCVSFIAYQFVRPFASKALMKIVSVLIEAITPTAETEMSKLM